jgi:hypothetical protein
LVGRQLRKKYPRKRNSSHLSHSSHHKFLLETLCWDLVDLVLDLVLDLTSRDLYTLLLKQMHRHRGLGGKGLHTANTLLSMDSNSTINSLLDHRVIRDLLMASTLPNMDSSTNSNNLVVVRSNRTILSKPRAHSLEVRGRVYLALERRQRPQRISTRIWQFKKRTK